MSNAVLTAGFAYVILADLTQRIPQALDEDILQMSKYGKVTKASQA